MNRFFDMSTVELMIWIVIIACALLALVMTWRGERAGEPRTERDLDLR